MIRKLVAIVVAALINVAVFAGFHNMGTAVAADPAPPQRTVLILPAITVHPTGAQIESLRRQHEAPKPGLPGKETT